MPELRKNNPYPYQLMMEVPKLDEYSDTNKSQEGYWEERFVTNNPDTATVVTSIVERKLGQGIHKPVLDIDFYAQLTPSSTPGHFHLFLDKEMTWEQYRKLLDVLTEVGIIEQGYRNVSVERGHTAVRLPWVKKPKLGSDDFPW